MMMLDCRGRTVQPTYYDANGQLTKKIYATGRMTSPPVSRERRNGVGATVTYNTTFTYDPAMNRQVVAAEMHLCASGQIRSTAYL